MIRLPTGSYLVLIAAGAGLSAAARAMPIQCHGGSTMSADPQYPNGRTTIVRSGTGHKSSVSQHDPMGTLHVEQHGEDHATIAVQSGNGDKLVINQSGAGARADVAQNGACNDAALTQSGADNHAQVTQSGAGNRVVILQRAAADTDVRQ